jgi:Fusaric acid resistance protein-like
MSAPRHASSVATAQAIPPTHRGAGRWRLGERWRLVTRIDRAGLAPGAGIAGAIGYALPLIAGQLTGHTHEGVTASAGALVIAYADLGGRSRLQAQIVLAAAGCTCVAVLLGAVAEPSVIATASVVAAWAFLAGLSASLGPVPALVATLATWSLLLAGDLRLHGQSALSVTALIAAGVATQVMVSLASSRLRRPSVAHTTRGATDLRSPAVPHASRLALGLIVAVVAYRILSLGFGYWVPLTVLFVLRPDYETTTLRALCRGLGTLTGAGVAWLVLMVLGRSSSACLGLMVGLVGIAILLYRANYALSTLTLTAVIALVAQFGGGSPIGALVDRSIDVGFGTIIALSVFLIYPTRSMAATRGWRHRSKRSASRINSSKQSRSAV